MGFFDGVASAAKQAAKPAPQSSGLGAVVQAVAQGSQRGAQQAASTNVGAAAAVGASQGASQARAQAQAAHNALATAIQNVSSRPLQPWQAKGPLAQWLNGIPKYEQQVQALQHFLVQTGFVDSAKALGVQPIDLLYGEASKPDKAFLVSLMTAGRPTTDTPDSLPRSGNEMPIPAPQGWSAKPMPNIAPTPWPRPLVGRPQALRS